MNLTPEQLDMIKRLQPVFSEIIKEWSDEDLCYCNECGRKILTYEKHSHGCPVEPIWLPKPIDWQNPERGLWGMLDWKQWYFDQTNICGEISFYNGVAHSIKSDPFTALLKALCEQEGV